MSRRFSKRMAVTLFVMLGLSVSAHANDVDAHSPKLGSIRNVRDVVDVSVSPDGQQVAATVLASTAEGGQTHIWLTGRGAMTPRQLTFSSDASGKGERGPAWSPDGAALFYHSTTRGMDRVSRLVLKDGSTQALDLVSNQSGQPVARWTTMAGSEPAKSGAAIRLHRFAMSPDGRWIAVVGAQGNTDKPRKQKPFDDAFEPGIENTDKPSLYLLRLSSMQVSQRVLDDNVQSLGWSADSRKMVVVTGSETDEAGYSGKLWQVSVDDGSPRRIDGVSATVHSAAWSHDGLAYLARCQEQAPVECLQLFAWTRQSRTSHALTRGLRGDLLDDMVIDADGRHVVMPIMLGMTQRLARIRLSDGQLAWVDLPQPVALQAASNAAHSAWAVLASGPATPKSILLMAQLGDPPTVLAIPQLVPTNWPAIRPQPLHWRNQGLSLEGLLYLPDIRLTARAPLVVWVHGGPYSAFQNRYYRLINMLVAHGWAVLITNPRGSMGYGAAFASANRNDLGGADYADIMAGVDRALARFPLDPARMAMIGYSYGGTMTAFTEGRTDRFKALIAGAPVINQFSEYGTEDSSYDDRWYFGKPWEHPASAWRQSALAYATNASTPLLLLQGQADEVDPVSQSAEMYRAMRQSGVPVTWVVYPRETHESLAQLFGLGSSREPFHGIDVARRMIGFLSEAFHVEAQ